ENVPYGEKSNEEILNYAESAVKFMIENDVKAIVIACNTATSVAAKYLREKYSIPIIGMEPAVKPAVEIKNHKKILV
ncbi:aspartate/glutamate racemase family protein, partial [Acinetobacter baumannii]|nr:aspartate/glutamate racemase family protein [Acinetobacter baumannii]